MMALPVDKFFTFKSKEQDYIIANIILTSLTRISLIALVLWPSKYGHSGLNPLYCSTSIPHLGVNLHQTNSVDLVTAIKINN